MQPSSTNTVIRFTALIVCAAMGVIRMVQAISFGPQVLPYLHDASALLAKLIVGGFAVSPAAHQVPAFWLSVVLYVLFLGIFAAAFLMRTSTSIKRSGRIDVFLLLVQALLAVAVEPGLRYILVLEFALVLPRRAALLSFGGLVLAQIARRIGYAMFPAAVDLICHVAGVEPTARAARESFEFMELGVDIVWQALAFCGGYIASSEKRSRLKLADAHAELLATQQLLGDALRASERARIASSLHNVIGRHLGDLNAHLDQAAAQAPVPALASIHTSQELAQRLQAEVRGVVEAEGRDQLVNLRQTLETLCAGIPFPRIALSFDDALEINSHSLAHTIFCSIQEAITNAVRHSGASLVRIALLRNGDGVAIDISDNGRGHGRGGRRIDEGNGLRGIRERVEEMAGTLTAGNLPEGGFGMQIWLPFVGERQ